MVTLHTLLYIDCMLPTNQSFHCNSNVEQFCFHAKETKCHMQFQHMLRTNDASMRGQKWGLRAAIYVPGWEKYHFLVLFYLINNVPFPHYFPKSPADNLRWYSFSLRLTCAQPLMSRISFAGKDTFPRYYHWETIICKVHRLLVKGKEWRIYQMMSTNCTH